MLPNTVRAHEFPCGHDHLPGSAGQVFLQSVCNDEASPCTAGCFDITTRNGQSYCSCGQSDCETAVAATFVPVAAGPVEANTTRTFKLRTSGMEALSVLVEEMEVASFGTSDEDTFGPDDVDAVDGSATIEFGSFDDPEAVEATVTDLFIQLATLVGDDKQSGLNTVELRDGAPIFMLYDSTNNTFRLAEEGAIALELDLENDLAGRQQAVMYFDGHFDADGNLAIFGQLAVSMEATAIVRQTWGQAKFLLRQMLTGGGDEEELIVRPESEATPAE